MLTDLPLPVDLNLPDLGSGLPTLPELPATPALPDLPVEGSIDISAGGSLGGSEAAGGLHLAL